MSKILLIDTQEVRAKVVKRRLSLWGLECSIAENFLFALTTLEWQRPDILLIREDNIDGMTAVDFAKSVRQDPTLAGIQLIRVTEPDTAEVAHSRHFDLMLAPQDTRSLVEQLAKIQKHREPEDTLAPADTSAETDIPGLAPRKVDRDQFAELIEHLNLRLESGRLVVKVEDSSHSIFLIVDHGQIVHAVFGGLEGPPAFRRVLGELTGSTRIGCHFEPEPRWKIGAYPRTIQQASRRRLLQQANQPDEFATQDIELKQWRQ